MIRRSGRGRAAPGRTGRYVPSSRIRVGSAFGGQFVAVALTRTPGSTRPSRRRREATSGRRVDRGRRRRSRSRPAVYSTASQPSSALGGRRPGGGEALYAATDGCHALERAAVFDRPPGGWTMISLTVRPVRAGRWRARPGCVRRGFSRRRRSTARRSRTGAHSQQTGLDVVGESAGSGVVVGDAGGADLAAAGTRVVGGVVGGPFGVFPLAGERVGAHVTSARPTQSRSRRVRRTG